MTVFALRKIGVVTSGRCDYGILVPLLDRIQESTDLSLELFVTGTHLLENFGFTVNQIERDGYPIAARVPADSAEPLTPVAYPSLWSRVWIVSLGRWLAGLRADGAWAAENA